MTNNELVAEIVENGKIMIMDDICNAVVPSTIKRFNDLHHYVDANEYLLPATDVDFDTLVEISQLAAYELDEWIKAGI
jgi:hypothetical protein